MTIKGVEADFSRPFDVHSNADYPAVRDLTNQVLKELLSHEIIQGTRGRKRPEKALKKLKYVLRAVLVDLFVAWDTHPKLCLGYSSNKNNYNEGTRYAKLHLTYKAMMDVVNNLEEMGYIETSKAYLNHFVGVGKSKRMRATDKLVKLFEAYNINPYILAQECSKEFIQLKDSDKNLIEFSPTPETEQMEKNIKKINEHINCNMINLCVTDEQEQAMREQLAGKAKPWEKQKQRFISFHQTHLHRVFNNGSFTEGGRFYGAWWQAVPKAYRKHITINGGTTVEMDFSGMHVNMLYRREGHELQGDAYSLEGYPTSCRPLIKTVFNAMLNSEDGKNDPRKHQMELLPTDKTFKQLKADILKRHEPIAQYFQTGEGLKLQFEDSQIAEKVMLKVIESKKLNPWELRNIVVLPVHDSFIIPACSLKAHKNLPDIMQEAFEEVVGGEVNITCEKVPTLGVYKAYEVQYLKDKYGSINDIPLAYNEDIREASRRYELEYSRYHKRNKQWLKANSKGAPKVTLKSSSESTNTDVFSEK